MGKKVIMRCIAWRSDSRHIYTSGQGEVICYIVQFGVDERSSWNRIKNL